MMSLFEVVTYVTVYFRCCLIPNKYLYKMKTFISAFLYCNPSGRDEVMYNFFIGILPGAFLDSVYCHRTNEIIDGFGKLEVNSR